MNQKPDQWKGSWPFRGHQVRLHHANMALAVRWLHPDKLMFCLQLIPFDFLSAIRAFLKSGAMSVIHCQLLSWLVRHMFM